MGRGLDKPKLLAGRFSRAERIRQRSKIQLDDVALSSKTQTRYYMAIRKLLPFMERAKSEDQLDPLVAEWVRLMWRQGEPLLTIGDGLSALHYFQPWTKKKIPHSWKLFAVWRGIELPSRAPPLTKRITTSLAAYEWDHDHFEMAVVLLLAFECLLRTGEALAVTPYDFSIGSRSGICSLKATKSGQRNSVDEVISIVDPTTLEVLRLFLEVRKQQNAMSIPLWSGSANQFRVRFKQLCLLAGLQQYNFRPYSLRRGGATHVFQTTRSMEQAMLRGRWNSSKVAKLYISDGLSFIPSIRPNATMTSFLNTYSFPVVRKA